MPRPRLSSRLLSKSRRASRWRLPLLRKTVYVAKLVRRQRRLRGYGLAVNIAMSYSHITSELLCLCLVLGPASHVNLCLVQWGRPTSALPPFGTLAEARGLVLASPPRFVDFSLGFCFHSPYIVDPPWVSCCGALVDYMRLQRAARDHTRSLYLPPALLLNVVECMILCVCNKGGLSTAVVYR